MSDFTIRTSTTPPATVKVQFDASQSVAEAVAAADAAAASEAAADGFATAAAGSATDADASAGAANASAISAAGSAAAASTDADDAAASAAAAAATLASSLKIDQNLSDLDNAATALTNLGLTATAAELNTLDGVTTTTAQLNSVQQFTGRNLIINGSGRINQRNYTSGAATTSANQFTLDRWFVITSGQSLTFTGNESGRVMTAPAGGVSQVIEGANIVGGTYVLNWTGTATATVNGTARTKGETFTLTANTNVTVRFTGGTFSEAQLERGSVVTPFEHRSIGQELALCQRYFQTVAQGIAGQAVTAAAAALSYSPPVVFRALPTVSLSAAAALDWPFNASYTQSSANISASFSSDRAINLNMQNFSGLTVHSRLVLRNDGGRVNFDAELTS